MGSTQGRFSAGLCPLSKSRFLPEPLLCLGNKPVENRPCRCTAPQKLPLLRSLELCKFATRALENGKRRHPVPTAPQKLPSLGSLEVCKLATRGAETPWKCAMFQFCPQGPRVFQVAGAWTEKNVVRCFLVTYVFGRAGGSRLLPPPPSPTIFGSCYIACSGPARKLAKLALLPPCSLSYSLSDVQDSPALRPVWIARLTSESRATLPRWLVRVCLL